MKIIKECVYSNNFAHSMGQIQCPNRPVDNDQRTFTNISCSQNKGRSKFSEEQISENKEDIGTDKSNENDADTVMRESNLVSSPLDHGFTILENKPFGCGLKTCFHSQYCHVDTIEKLSKCIGEIINQRCLAIYELNGTKMGVLEIPCIKQIILFFFWQQTSHPFPH